MRITGRDLVFIAVVGALLLILLISTGKEKPKNIPRDNKHLAIIEKAARGESREEAEKVCVACHNPHSIPLPRNHPPKEQCLLCHRGDS